MMRSGLPSPDAIEQFKVQTGLYDAEFGKQGGGSINMVTKSGGAQFHGSAFEFFRNTALNANGFQALLDAGADAFVGRSQSPQDLRTALLALVEGSTYLVSPRRRGTTMATRSSNSGLTLREMQVLRLLCAGFSNKEVARQLAMSVRTVE